MLFLPQMLFRLDLPKQPPRLICQLQIKDKEEHSQRRSSLKCSWRKSWRSGEQFGLKMQLLIRHMLHLMSMQLPHILAIQLEQLPVKWTIVDKVSRKPDTKIAYVL